MDPNSSPLKDTYSSNDFQYLSEESTEDECDFITTMDVSQEIEILETNNIINSKTENHSNLQETEILETKNIINSKTENPNNLQETEILETNNLNILSNFLNVYESDLPDYFTEENFTLFWKSAEKEYFRGEDVIVPFVPIHRIRKDRNIFKTLGKILGHMWMNTNTIPLNIAQTIYLLIDNPLRDIPDNVLLEDMLMFVTQEESVLIDKALTDFSKLEWEELSLIKSFFLSNGYYESPNPEEFREQLLSIASDLIIYKPRELVIQMRKGFPSVSLSSLMDIIEKNQISELLAKQKPTVQKVLNILNISTNILSDEELKVIYYLRMYIKSLVNDYELLLKYLFFVTGTVQMPKQIFITFNNSTSTSRQIVANKCTCTLELSFAYHSYQEFKRELNTYLSPCFS